MSDISSSAAKDYVLKEAGELRISSDAVQLARELGHKYLTKLGVLAGDNARQAGRKTIMPSDLQAAADVLNTAPVATAPPAPTA